MKTCGWLLALVVVPALFGQKNDWLIVPGQRVGPILANTVRADLPHSFAPGATIDDLFGQTGVHTQYMTVVSREFPAEALTIFWDGAGPDAHPRQIVLCQGRGPCRWHTASGISTGTRLAEVQKLRTNPLPVDDRKIGIRSCPGLLTLTLNGEPDSDPRVAEMNFFFADPDSKPCSGR